MNRTGTSLPAKTMKTNRIIGIVLLLALLPSLGASGLPKEEGAKLKKTLQSAPRPELPARAAEAVKRAKPDDRNEVAAIVVSSVAETRPASLVAVVASIASAVPAAAPRAVAEAARLNPSQAAGLANVAAKAAPSFADEIGRAAGRSVKRASLKIEEVTVTDVVAGGIGGGVGGGWGNGVGGGQDHPKKNYGAP